MAGRRSIAARTQRARGQRPRASEPDAAAAMQCRRRHGRKPSARRRDRRARPRDAGREPGRSVTLVAVSKTFAAEAIVPVLEAGQRVFGENRVQEAKAKWPALRERFPGRASCT